jgi:apolipoprotein N-acyltransferase
MATTDLFVDAAIVAQVPLMQGATCYSRWGDWPVVLTVLVLLAPWITGELVALWKARQNRV